MTNAPHLDRLKEPLAKAERGSVKFEFLYRPIKVGSSTFRKFFTCVWKGGNSYTVTPAEFAQLKIDYADRFKGE